MYWLSHRLLDLRFQSWLRQELSLCSKMSRQALGPNHPPIQWISERGDLFLWGGKVTGARSWLLTPIQSSISEWVELYLCSPCRPLCGEGQVYLIIITPKLKPDHSNGTEDNQSYRYVVVLPVPRNCQGHHLTASGVAYEDTEECERVLPPVFKLLYCNLLWQTA